MCHCYLIVCSKMLSNHSNHIESIKAVLGDVLIVFIEPVPKKIARCYENVKVVVAIFVRCSHSVICFFDTSKHYCLVLQRY